MRLLSKDQQKIMEKFLELMNYVQVLETDEDKSYSLEELSKIWGIDKDKIRSIIRKLRREGFIRRTRSGRFKLTLAAKILIMTYRRIKR